MGKSMDQWVNVETTEQIKMLQLFSYRPLQYVSAASTSSTRNQRSAEKSLILQSIRNQIHSCHIYLGEIGEEFIVKESVFDKNSCNQDRAVDLSIQGNVLPRPWQRLIHRMQQDDVLLPARLFQTSLSQNVKQTVPMMVEREGAIAAVKVVCQNSFSCFFLTQLN